MSSWHPVNPGSNRHTQSSSSSCVPSFPEVEMNQPRDNAQSGTAFQQTSPSEGGLSEGGPTSTEPSEQMDNEPSDQHRRRRTGGTITSLACTECRKARAKCDGTSPGICTRCHTRNLSCRYEPHTKTQKGELIQQIQTYRDRESILMKLLFGKHGRSGELWHEDAAEEALRRYEEDAEALAQVVSQRGQAERKRATGGIRRTEDMFEANEDLRLICEYWTFVTSNSGLVQHLLDLYFTWVHPNHMLFSENAFLKDFQVCKEDKQSACSKQLVNAICAMACSFLSSKEDEPDLPHFEADCRLLKKAFLEESRYNLKPDGWQWLTSIQSLAILYLVEMSSGHGRVATTYLRSAAEQLPPSNLELHQDELWEASSWGIHTLNTAWCAFTFQKPFNPQKESAHVPPLLVGELERGERTLQGNVRPDLAVQLAPYHANLFRIVHRTLTMYCGARGKVTGDVLFRRSKEYDDWRLNLPPELQVNAPDDIRARPFGVGGQPFSAIISLHVQYFAATVGLFVPILEHSGSSDNFRQYITSKVLMLAEEGLRIVKRSTPEQVAAGYLPMTLQSVIHLCDAVVRFGQSYEQKHAAVRLCTELMVGNRSFLSLAEPLMHMFRTSVHMIEPSLCEVIDASFQLEEYGLEELLEACTRLNYALPMEQIGRFVDPNLENQYNEAAARASGQRHPTSTRAMRVDDMLNDS